VRVIPVCLAVLLAGGVASAAERELRPPDAKVEIELAPGDDAAELRIFWSCYARDLGAATRSWVRGRAAARDCAADAALGRDEKALLQALESAAGGRVLGHPVRGEVREVDASPGREKQITASFCYAAADVEQIAQWARRQLAALCEAGEGE
jgi:hypothetical protein